MKNANTSLNSLRNRRSKDKQFKNELSTIFQYLLNNVCTASMVSEATGIKQKNITRYKADLQRKGMLVEVYKAYCKVTGHKAYYITTNPQLIPVKQQTNLFENGNNI